VERCLLGAPPLVTVCGTASPRGAAGSIGDRSGGSRRSAQSDQESGSRPGGVPRGMASAAASGGKTSPEDCHAGGAAGPKPRRCGRRPTSLRASRARWTTWPRRWRPSKTRGERAASRSCQRFIGFEISIHGHQPANRRRVAAAAHEPVFQASIVGTAPRRRCGRRHARSGKQWVPHRPRLWAPRDTRQPTGLARGAGGSPRGRTPAAASSCPHLSSSPGSLTSCPRRGSTSAPPRSGRIRADQLGRRIGILLKRMRRGGISRRRRGRHAVSVHRSTVEEASARRRAG